MPGAGRSTGSGNTLEQLDWHPAAAHLVDAAPSRRLVGAPAQEFGAVAEAAAAEMVVLGFHHQLGIKRLPFAGALGAPATYAAWGFAGKAATCAGGFFQFLDLGR